MAYKLFLDANVILDYILKRPEGYKSAKVIFEGIVRGEHQAFTSPVVIHIVAHIVRKVLGPPQTKKIVLALLNDVLVWILPTTLLYSSALCATLASIAVTPHLNTFINSSS